MLKQLNIKNYALIEALEMTPSEQLNIITGETGAGKSIMLGAVGLLLGNRADTKALYDKDQKCVVEGTFSIAAYGLQEIFEEEELDFEDPCILRREIAPSGKSRAFINDTPVRLESMKKIGNFLMDIHSQHDNLQLGNNAFQMQIVDAFAGNKQLIADYRDSYLAYIKAKKSYDQLNKEATAIRNEADYNNYLYEELKNAELSEGEQERLEEELQLMENAGNIKEQLSFTYNTISYGEPALDDYLARVNEALIQIAGYSTKYASLQQRIESCLIELRDIGREAENLAETVDFDPSQTEATRERLNLIYNLQQKHQVSSVDELLQIRDNLEAKVNKVENLDEELTRLQEEKEKAYNAMIGDAWALSESRKQVFDKISKEVSGLLKDLGMPDAKINIELKTIDPSPTGIDEINMLFSANKGISPQNIKSVASGGEFSRLMFCFKYILADKTALPTIIFDEIDTGVSGEIAIKMVEMMRSMAQNHQVIAISHLPQVAAKGDAHYFVFKDNTQEKAVSGIKELNGDERILEIAKMIGGDNPSKIAYENAKELLGV